MWVTVGLRHPFMLQKYYFFLLGAKNNDSFSLLLLIFCIFAAKHVGYSEIMENTTKALFFDIDGTLVSFCTHMIPQSTVEALEQAKRNGVKIYISTGRPIMIINNLGQIDHLIDGYITTNGARCFVGDHLVCQHGIDRRDVNRVLADADRKDYPVIVVGERHLVVYHPTDVVREIFVDGLGVHNIDFSVNMDCLDGEEVLQLTPFCSVEQEAQLMPALHHCTAGRWHPAFVDITSGDADKGKGLHAMADYLELDISQTMAFGDGGNDISIIREAGIGVAMGNARDNVKAIADYVTSHVDEDGVKNALLHFGII